MRPGQVYVDDQFKTRDGKVFRKFCIVLTQKNHNTYLVVKTTSQSGHYAFTPGCMMDPTYHSFFVPAGTESSCFPIDTWAQLDSIYPMSITEVLTKGMTKVITSQGVLSNVTLKALLTCASHSDDISLNDAQLLLQTTSKL
jgi:hypothetical protein